MTIEKTIAAALEPLAESVAALEMKIGRVELPPPPVEVNIDDVVTELLGEAEFIKLAKGAPGRDGQDGAPGERGEKGEPGKDGAPGLPGVGVNLEQWAPGIYRKDSIVQHDLGCISIALRDTNDKPGDSADWGRVGSGGFRWCGIKQEGREYRDGDLYIDNGTTFLFVRDKGVMFAKRGKDGADGKHGRDGADAAQLIEVRILDDFKALALAMDDGRVIECPIPEMAALRSQLDTFKAELSEMRDMLQALTQARKPKGAAYGN